MRIAILKNRRSDFCCRVSYPSIRKTRSDARVAKAATERKRRSTQGFRESLRGG
jgi:hypothetical protein